MLPRIKSLAILADLGNHVQKLSFRCSRSFHTASVYHCQKPEETPVKGVPYKNLSIGVPKEMFPGERRVAISPTAVKALTKKGITVNIEEGAGLEAKFTNADFTEAGANVLSRSETFKSDIVLKVRPPQESELGEFKEGGTLISFLYPQQNEQLIKDLAARKLTTFAMDKVPRISRAQVFDALSSMANISGYKAVIEAANNYGRFFSGKLNTVKLNRLYPKFLPVVAFPGIGYEKSGCPKYTPGRVAQWLGRAPADQKVLGSNPDRDPGNILPGVFSPPIDNVGQ